MNNGLTGSSWHFNCFLYINVKILSVSYQLINYFGNMTDFLDFQAVKDNKVNEMDDTEENFVENVSDVDFIDDEDEFNESVADYYTFTNVSRSFEDATLDFSSDFDYSQEANSYCPENYDLNNEIADKFKDSGKKAEHFKSTLLI